MENEGGDGGCGGREDAIRRDLAELQDLFWKKDREIEDLKSKLRAEQTLSRELERKIEDLEVLAEREGEEHHAMMKELSESAALMERCLELQEKLSFDTNRYQNLNIRCADLQEKNRSSNERIQQLQTEILELQKLKEITEKKAGADNIRLSKMVADLQEKYSIALTQNAEMQKTHAGQVEKLQADIEKQVLQASSGGRGGDAIQMYRTKLMAQQEEIRMLKEELSAKLTATPSQPNGSRSVDRQQTPEDGTASTPRRTIGHQRGQSRGLPTLKGLDRFSQVGAQIAQMDTQKKVSPYGRLLGSSSDEDSNISLIPKAGRRSDMKAKRVRRL